VSGQRMATADAAWLHMDRTTNLMVVNCVFWFDQPLDWDLVAAAFGDRLLPSFPHFSELVVDPPVTMGAIGPRWEPAPGFSVADHLVRASLPAPGGEAELHAYASAQARVPLDASRPLWQAHLIDGYGTGSAVLLRTHHALADGTALVQALLTLVDSAEGGPHVGQLPLRPADALPRGEHLLRTSTDRWAKTVVEGWRTALAGPHQALEGARTIASQLASVRRLGAGGADDPSSLRAPLSGDKSLTWSRPVPLERVRQAGKKAGATVNDLALTAMAGALRRFLLERGEDVSRLTAVVPVNLRPTDQPFDPAQGNQFGLAFVPLPVGEPVLATRMRDVCAAMHRVKSTSEAVVVYEALSVMGQTPTQLSHAWIDLFSDRSSAVITNVPGPREAVSLAGVPVRGFVAWVPATGAVGVGFSVCSYAGELVLGVAVDTALVEDSAALLALLADELELVLQAADATPGDDED
jgi:diacylglycerol O-acyltransferase